MFEKWRWKHGDLATQYKLFADVGKESFSYSILSSTDFHACLKLMTGSTGNYSWYSSDRIWLGWQGNHIIIVRDRIPIGQMKYFAEWMQKVHKDYPALTFVFFTSQREPMRGWTSEGIIFYTINPKDYDRN